MLSVDTPWRICWVEAEVAGPCSEVNDCVAVAVLFPRHRGFVYHHFMFGWSTLVDDPESRDCHAKTLVRLKDLRHLADV
ncbi:hypothetical protein ES702_01089 [subsurface metagenome]